MQVLTEIEVVQVDGPHMPVVVRPNLPRETKSQPPSGLRERDDATPVLHPHRCLEQVADAHLLGEEAAEALRLAGDV
jgi:hypothetical protein